MKNIHFLIFVGLGLVWAGCNDENSSPSVNDQNLCEQTGGTLQDNKCVCGGETCTDAKWCDSNGKCSTDTKLTPDLLCAASGGQAKNNKCVCSDVECDEGVLCNLVTKKCAQTKSQPAQVTFADLCIHSGGTMSEDKCKCGDETCDKDKICDGDGKCSKDTTADTYTICVNDENYVGWINQCTGSDCQKTKCEIDINGTKNPVSCNGNQCGTCLNYTNNCENDSEHENVGVVYSCREGQKIKVKTCEGGFSCISQTCKDISCADEVFCGECVEGSFKCEMGNVPEDTVLLNADSSTIKVPKGFITGFRSKCINGRWKKLALGDKENCYYGHVQDYVASRIPERYKNIPRIELDNRDIVTVWGYDSSGNHAGKEYFLAACADDGINCGECMFSFAYCSYDQWYFCHEGKVIKTLCSEGCSTNSSCTKSSTTPYCNGTQCQNCKSICNWE